jgi:hypothetical protein
MWIRLNLMARGQNVGTQLTVAVTPDRLSLVRSATRSARLRHIESFALP